MNKIKYLVLFSIIILCKLSVFAQIPYSGIYNKELYIGINDKDKELRGFYYNQSDDGKLGCTFLIYGKFKTIEDTVIDIIAYYPLSGDTTIGKIYCPSKKMFKLKLIDNPVGCSKLENFSNHSIIYKLSEQTKWKAVRVVKSRNTAIHNQPNSNSLKVSKLINGDYVYVHEQKGDWLKIELDRLETQIGWVKIEHFY